MDVDKVNEVLQRSIPAPEERDVVMVLVNDPEYGGSGGAVAVVSVHSDAPEIVLHELGHSFVLLADEYDTSPPACDKAKEPPEVNVTKQKARRKIKWLVWIAKGTPTPTKNTEPGVPGLYQGAKYCTAGLYRSTFDSKMRSLGKPFDQINTEEHVKRVYNVVSPIDVAKPGSYEITLKQGKTRRFTAKATRPRSHDLEVTWELDGQEVGTGKKYTLKTGTLQPGTYTLIATVSDPTTLVRNDPDNVLRESRSWTIEVVAK